MGGATEARRNATRAFVYRGAVRIAGTVVACDAAAGTDLVFLSHAPALGIKSRRELPGLGKGRRRLCCTEITLALLGPAGQRLRPHALVAAFGRPFALGGARLELFPSGYMPGAASLLCERDGRRILYAGPIGDGPDVRAADALCLDATFATAGSPPLSEAEALVAAGKTVRETLGAGLAPVVLVDRMAMALALGAALAGDRIALRGHREIVQAAGGYRDAGLAAPPVERFAGKLGPGEVLLWPAAARPPGRRGGTRPFRFVPVSVGADSARLLRYVDATGASEVALVNAPTDDLLQTLQARGLDAYTLGPPRQIGLFAADAA